MRSSSTRRTAVAAMAVAGCLLLQFSGPGSAFAHARRTSYCTPTGDYCEFAEKVHGRRKFELRTFVQRGVVQVCVHGPGRHHDCESSRLRRAHHTIYVSKVDWRRRFPFYGKGGYTVAWWKDGYKIGKTLGFRVR